MQRPIVGFGVDDANEPIAVLSCGHPQHVRHQPPFQSRPWVMSSAGRADMLGKPLNCVRCERLELPLDFIGYKRTPIFTETSVPTGLLRDHATKAGVWARIVVLAGRLRYRVASLGLDQELAPGAGGVVAPEVLHCVEALGAVSFYVEFYHAPRSLRPCEGEVTACE